MAVVLPYCRMRKRLLPSFSSVALLLGMSFCVLACATIRGEISKGRYTSPGAAFTVPVPEMALGMKIQDQGDADEGMVSFHDDVGTLRRIDYLRLPPDAPALHSDPTRRDASYRGFLHDYVFPSVRSGFPGTVILDERFVGKEKERSYFVVLRIPEGSTLMSLATGKRLDSIRSHLIFSPDDRFMYMLSSAKGWNSFGRVEQAELDEEAIKASIAELQQFRSTIEFR